jgi:hypothetical protein
MTTLTERPLVGTYDDERHVYEYAGRRLLSVHDVMTAGGLLDGIMGDDYALWRGTAIHLAIELHVKGTLDINTVDTRIAPALGAYIEFERATGFKVVESEKPYYNAPLGIACKPDLLGRFPDGQEAIVELKSGGLAPWVRVQTAGQDTTIGGGITRKRYGLSIPVTGKPSVRPYWDTNDYAVFFACLTLASFKNLHQKTWRKQ